MTPAAVERCSSLLWPHSRTHDAVIALARARRLPLKGIAAAAAATVEAQAAALGLEAEYIDAYYDDVETVLSQADGMLLSVAVAGVPGWILVVKGGPHRLLLLSPDLRLQNVKRRLVRDVVCAPLETMMSPVLETLLAALPMQRKPRVRQALLRAHLGKSAIVIGWLLRAAPSTNFFSQLWHAGLCRRALWLMAAHAATYGLGIFAWILIGAAALGGRYDPGWWQAWVLLIVSLGGLRALSGWWQTQLLTGTATLLKHRLLYGTLRANQDEARREGAGQLLGRVLEVQAIESVGLNGGLSAMLTVFEIVACLVLLAYGAAGGLHVALLLGWLALAGCLVKGYVSRRWAWTDSRLALTQYLTEQMLGHRTRLAQQPLAQWHEVEDTALSRYNDQSRDMDRSATILTTLVPRGWLILGLLALAPALLAGGSLHALAIGVGATLLAYGALQKVTTGTIQLATAAIAWKKIAPVFRAGRQEAQPALLSNSTVRSDTVLAAHDIVFRYHRQGQAILQGIDLQVRHGERILLEGTSGSGKSTLANIISGLRQPESGLLLVNGLDQRTLGDSWRRYAVNVPQFHENHLLSDSLAFNLLLGRRWPPTPADLQAAEALCRQLGLGELLERMPGGLWQSVGESGWRLSHGERSRVYLARALLHPAALIIFDESFAALDPENLACAIECVLARAPSLIVIAHP